MKFIALFTFGIVVSAAWADDPALSPLEREAIAASQSRVAAFNRRDPAALERLVAENFLFTDDNGGFAGKRQRILAFVRNHVPADDQIMNPRDYHARTLGDVVVLKFIYDEREHFTSTDIVSKLTSTEVWSHSGGSWVLAAKSVTPIPVNHRQAIAVDSHKLVEYVGRYEWRPGAQEVLSVLGDRLVSIRPGQDPTPSYFVAPDINVEEDDLGEMIFQRNSAGEVTSAVYRRPDGQSFSAKKQP